MELVGNYEMGWETAQVAKRKELCKRFGMYDGQWFATYYAKNQNWVLNGTEFGYGDLRPEDIERIAESLEDDETFEAFHATLRVGMEPTVRIVKGEFTFPFQQEQAKRKEARNAARTV